MVEVAGFRGALLNPYRIDAASVGAAPVTGVRARLAGDELVRDSHTSVYRYHQTFGTRTRKTTLAAVELHPWNAGVIRAHERTSGMARELATRGITTEAAHTEALFCGYRDEARELDRLLALIERQQPALVVTTADGTLHTLWRESDPNVIELVRALFAPKKLHVLDGHARYDGMLAYRDSFGELPARSAARFGLTCLANLDDVGQGLAARHRVVRGPKGRMDVLTAAKPFFEYERVPGGAVNSGKQQAALAELGDRCGFLALFPNDPDAWKLALLPSVKVNAGQRIDPIVVEDVFLGRVVQGAKARSVLEPATVVKAVSDGAVGLILRPIALANVLRADETGELLPFGSTAFCPPLARLVTYLIDPNEQLS
jgi:uncharacterized protein (DUF1015 family)